MNKRTYSYNEFTKLVKEGIEDIGFKPYIQENEEELGAGEEVSTPSTTEEVPASETPAPPAEAPIDLGDKESVSLEEIKLKIDFINNFLKGINNLVVSADKVPLDKFTKDKIVKLYNLVQGIV